MRFPKNSHAFSQLLIKGLIVRGQSAIREYGLLFPSVITIYQIIELLPGRAGA
jgi:hypothetical protein